jgi:ankyrin repeat protein
VNTTPLEVYRYLIETKGCDVNVQDKNGNTPLIYALRCFQRGNITVLTYLLSHKDVNVNIKTSFGYTLLHDACERINVFPIEVFKVLIETRGFDVNVQNNFKNTPIHCAIDSFNASYGGDITVLTYLLSQKDININIKSHYGYTILHTACKKISKLPLDVFKVLIKTRGFDVNAQDDNNHTPLHHAVCNFDRNNRGDLTVLMYLLSREDVNINIKTSFGYTLLHIACQLINHLPLDVFKVLIETHGGDVNVQAENKDTPIHLALRLFNPHQGGVTVLTYLINQKNINVNIRGKQSHTSLHLACINNLSPRHSSEVNAECDTHLCQIVEVIAERGVQQVLDEATS